MPSESVLEPFQLNKPAEFSAWLHQRGMVSVYIQRFTADWIIKSYLEGIVSPWDESVFSFGSTSEDKLARNRALRTASRRFEIASWGTFLGPRISFFPTPSIELAISLGLPKEYFSVSTRNI